MAIEERIETDIKIGGHEWLAVEMEVNNTRHDKADAVDFISAVPHPDEDDDLEPDYDDEVVVKLGSVSEEAERGEDTALVFTGRVVEFTNLQNGTWQIRAMNSLLDLNTETVSISTEDPVYLSTIVADVFEDVGVEYNIDLIGLVHWMRPGISSNRDIRVVYNENNVKAKKVLNDLGERAHATFWVDRNNVAQFGDTKTTNHKLEAVIDSSAGKTTPPYRSVRVVGDGVVSRTGDWQKKDLITQNPISATGTVRGVVKKEHTEAQETTELPKPTFTYKSKEIRTQEEANQIKEDLLQKLEAQTSEGTVTVVGRPDIALFDTIEMPDELGGERYLVKSVKHRVNSTDGFITKIGCGGLVEV